MDISIAERNDNICNLNFAFLELTNTCNLECVHCYTNSSPKVVDKARLSLDEYKIILGDIYDQGCLSIQFIGGEPTLNKMLPDLILLSKNIGFETIEVYTNLINLPDKLLNVFVENDIQVATSIYSHDAVSHDLVTTRPGSWKKTIRNLNRILEAGLSIRVSVVEIDSVNGNSSEATIKWLESLGIENIGFDKLRKFGRGANDECCEQSELCGECSRSTICIGPDGVTYPCIMSKAWPVGSVREQSFGEIMSSERLKDVRQSIYEQTLAKKSYSMGGCNPDRPHPCNPDNNPCNPCNPNGNCGPNKCRPFP